MIIVIGDLNAYYSVDSQSSTAVGSVFAYFLGGNNFTLIDSKKSFSYFKKKKTYFKKILRTIFLGECKKTFLKNYILIKKTFLKNYFLIKKTFFKFIS